jgi:hypothetical protein
LSEPELNETKNSSVFAPYSALKASNYFLIVLPFYQKIKYKKAIGNAVIL